MADFVKQKRDLGCKAHTVTSIDEKRSLMGSGKTFFGLIGGLGDYMSKFFMTINTVFVLISAQCSKLFKII